MKSSTAGVVAVLGLAVLLGSSQAFAGEVELSSAAAPRATAVSGPVISISPTSHDFGRCDSVACFNFTVTNTGDTNLHISGTSESNPGHGFTITSVPGTIGPGQTGALTVCWTTTGSGPVSDNINVLSDAANGVFSLHVSAVANNCPVFNPPLASSYSTSAFVPFSLTAGATDPESDALSWSISGIPPSATFDVATGTLNWTPTSSDAGSYVVTICVTDGCCTTCSTFTLTVTAAQNHPPVLNQPVDMCCQAGSACDQVITASDPDGNPVTFSKVSGPTFLTVTTTAPGTGTGTGNVHIAPGFSDAGTYTVTIQVSDGAGGVVTKSFVVRIVGPGESCCVAPPDSMVGWWPLDEAAGPTAADLAGSVANDGTWSSSAPTPVAGKVGGALRFTSATQFVGVLDNSEINFGMGDLSIDAWVRTSDTALNNVQTILDKRTGTDSAPRGYSLFLYNGGLGFQLGDGTALSPPNFVTANLGLNDGNWHHVAVTVDRAAAAVRMYANGLSKPFSGPSVVTGSVTNTSGLRIGGRLASFGTDTFNGSIDEVELFNKVLTPSEVLAIWAADSLGKCKPGSIHGTKYNDRNGDGVRGGGEPGLSGWTIQLSGPSSSTAVAVTDASGSYAFSGLQPGTYTVSEVPQSGWEQTAPPSPPGTHTAVLGSGQTITDLDFGNRSVFCTGVRPDSMAAWWPLDEPSGTGTSADIAGFFPNNGTWLSGPTPMPGKVNGGLRFLSGQSESVPDHPEISFGTGSFTIDAWVQTSDTTRRIQVIVDKRADPGPGADPFTPPLGYLFSLYDGKPALQLGDGAERSDLVNFISVGSDLRDGLWHHVAVTVERPGGGVQFYVDAGTKSYSGSPILVALSVWNSSNLVIGNEGPGQLQGDLAFRGVIDELELFSRALTQAEIQAIFIASSAGKCPPGQLSGVKFNDLNSDGVRDLSEPGLPGWTIRLSGGANLTTTTDAQGRYWFLGLQPGTYTVSEEPRPGWVQTAPPSPGTHTAMVAAGQSITALDFGNSGHCVDPPADMVGWWPFDEVTGTTSEDLAGVVANDGTWLHPGLAPLLVGNMVGPAGLTFDGTSIGNVVVGNQAELNVGTGDFSIDTWIRTSVTENVAAEIAGKGGYPDNGYSFYLYGGAIGLQLIADGTYANYNSTKSVANGYWHHVAVTVDRDSTSGITFYVDGQKAGTGDPTGRAGSLDNTDYFLIGSYGGFQGDLDELELFNRALTPAEVAAIWGAASLGKCKPGTIRGMKFNDLDGDGVKDAGEPGLPGWTIQLGGASTARAMTDSSGQYSFMGLQPGTYTVSEVPQSGWVQTAPPAPGTHTVVVAAGQRTTSLDFGNLRHCVDPPDSMVGWWPLDEAAGPTAADLAGAVANNGTWSPSAPTPVAGKVGGALRFTSTAQFVDVPDNSEINFGMGDFSIDAWVRTSDTALSLRTILDKRTRDTTGAPLGYVLFLYNGLGFQLGDGTDPSPQNFLTANLGLNDGNWHHVAVTVDRAAVTVRMYVDGLSKPFSGPAVVTGSVTNTSQLRIGGELASFFEGTFNGSIDEVELFNKVLTPSEVQAIWAADSLGKCKGNSPPTVMCPDTVRVNEGVSLTFNISATDPNGDHVVLTQSGLPSIGPTFVDNGNNTATVVWTPNFNQSGCYTVVFSGFDPFRASDSCSTVICVKDVNRPPVCSNGGPYTGCVGDPMTFSSTGSSSPDGGPLTYSWDFGDGNSSTSPNPSHTYIAGGTYAVCLRVTDSAGQSDTCCTTATISSSVAALISTKTPVIRLSSGRPRWCAQIQPVNGSFSIVDVVFSTIVAKYGSVSIPVDPKPCSAGKNEIGAGFTRSNLRTLFAGLPSGRNTVVVTIEGSLTSGCKFTGTVTLEVVSSGAALGALVSPNPLNPQTKLSFYMAMPGSVWVRMFDVNGRLVRTLMGRTFVAAGYQELTVDGRGDRGETLASGVYFVRGWTPNGEFTIPMVILK